MEACYNLQTCMDSALEEDVKLCAKHGFDLIEINFDKARQYLADHTIENLKQLLDENGIRCATINAIFAISFAGEKEWERILGELNEACTLGKALGAKGVIALTSERVDLPEGVTDQQIYEDTIEVLKRMSDAAEESGMMVGLEPVGTMAVGDVKTAWNIVKDIDRANVGIVIDDFNLYLWDLGADFDLIRDIDPEKILITHINDAEKIPFAKVDQMHRCMPGDGRIDVAHYMECVRATGYDGPVSIEILNPGIWAKGPEAVIPEAREKIGRFVN